MRILLLNTSFPPQSYSAARLFHELGCELIARGHAVTVVTEFPRRRLSASSRAGVVRPRGFFSRETMDGIRVIRVRGFPFREESLLGRGLSALLVPFTFLAGALRSGPQDVVLVYSPPLTLGLAAILYRWLRRTPFVFNVQDIYPQTLVELGLLKNTFLIRIFERIERVCYKRAARVVVHSDGNRRYLVMRRGVSPEHVEAVFNWVDVDAIRPMARVNGFRSAHGLGSRFVVTYAGTMGYAQDLGAVLDAAARLASCSDILFLLVGEGVREAEWKARAADQGLANVRFLPLQPKDVYPDLLAASDVGLVPLTDRLRTPVVPGKLQDLMASGRPVVAAVLPDGDAARIVEESSCGVAVSPDDAAGIAAAITAMFEDPGLAAKFGENGRAYAEMRFSVRACATRYERLLEALIGGSSNGASLRDHGEGSRP